MSKLIKPERGPPAKRPDPPGMAWRKKVQLLSLILGGLALVIPFPGVALGLRIFALLLGLILMITAE